MVTKSKLLAPLFVLMTTGILAGCGDTWEGAKEDTKDNVEATGEVIEDTGEKIEDSVK